MVAGQKVVLSCVVLNYSGIVQWTKDGLALGMGQGLKGEILCSLREGRRGFFLGFLSYPPQGTISENASCPQRRDRAAGRVPPFPASASLLPSTTTPCSPTAPPFQHRGTER